MIGRPSPTEAAPYYFTYINQVTGENPLATIESQLDDSLVFFSTISEEKSHHRYAPDKWSIRQVLNHVTDTERAFAFRALWFSRGFDAPLPSYDQEIAARGAWLRPEMRIALRRAERQPEGIAIMRAERVLVTISGWPPTGVCLANRGGVLFRLL